MLDKKIKEEFSHTDFMLDNKKQFVEFDENEESVFCGTNKKEHSKIEHKCWI